MNSAERTSGKSERERGSSLIEVLISLFVLMILMIGILQMFSAAYVVNKKSSLRTLQAYKCQQVAEVLRMASIIEDNEGAPPGGIVFADNVTFDLPYNDAGENWNFWGPTGANIIEEAGAPYRIFYTITAGVQSWNVRIVSVESDKLRLGEVPSDRAPNLRRIEYVTQIPN